MGEKDDDFGLSLSLSLGRVNQQQQQPPPLNHMHQPQQLQTVPMNHNKTLFGDLSQLPGGGDDDGGGSDAARKKLRLTKEQSMVLEETFKEHSTLNPKRKQALAEELNLKPRQVEVWFQNRRARTKLKQTEVDCEYLKRCYENLTEENRRLHKEVQELRALKLSPQMYMHMNPPTTLTMCPSCERTHSFASSSTATVHSPATSSNRKLFGTNIRLPVSFNTRPFEGPIPRP
ncbi:Homeobox-leucine zipper protein HAT3 [Glycine soja]|nr:Homeobox-leucine zipper protein HAT3 [Glycine soja]